MLRKILGAVWRGAPGGARRWGVWLTQPRFTVSAGVVVTDAEGRVLLLNHVFRTGSGWGIPGGFLGKGEQPEEALRRELREEAGMELEGVRLVLIRTFKRPQQLELLYRCRAAKSTSAPRAQSVEIKSAAWFAPAELPDELSRDQRQLIERALADEKAGDG